MTGLKPTRTLWNRFAARMALDPGSAGILPAPAGVPPAGQRACQGTKQTQPYNTPLGAGWQDASQSGQDARAPRSALYQLNNRKVLTYFARFPFSAALVILILIRGPLCRAGGPVTTTLVPALGWDVNKQGGFPVSLASDTAGNIWVGTEGNGLWKYSPATKAWTQFTTNDGLGDDCVYALAFDQQNRLWAGHLNHGVSVYNGDKWRNYGLLDGPLGDRLFAIAVSPKDGDVWMATDMGLARYSEARQDWDYYTRASGLPSDQIQSIAFDNNGQLYAGTQCNGIAIAGPEDNYKKWRVVTASTSPPRAPFGNGLASDLINDLKSGIASAGSLSFTTALTPVGASVSPDGVRWFFILGEHWAENTPNPSAKVEGMLPAPMPAEDWMTTLAIEGTHAWVGYRKSGIESRDSATGAVEVQAIVPKGTAIIRAILPLPNQPPLIAAYDEAAGGLLTLSPAQAYRPAATSATLATGTAVMSGSDGKNGKNGKNGSNGNSGVLASGLQPSAFSLQPFPPLPAAAPAPTVDDAKTLSVRLGNLTQPISPGEAWYLADDWRTEGDWVQRYGNAYVKLCGMAEGDQDYSLQPGYEVRIVAGPHRETTDAGTAWYHGDDSSDDLRSLYDPILGHRRDAEENDRTYDVKTFPESHDGPGLLVHVKVPDGVHCLSLYFLNNDAHAKGGAKYRDYDVTVVPGDEDDKKVVAETPLARTRVTDFWGGVYKQFLVCGPADYVVRIGRNRSFVTKLQAVFVDRVTPQAADPPARLPGFDAAPYDPPDEPTDYTPTPLTDAAVNLWGQLDDGLSLRGAVPLQMPLHIWCYRAAVAGQAPAALLERFRWEISIWTPEDRKKFDDAMKAARDAAK